MAAIGVDTHKFSLAACAVDERGAVVSEASFANDPAGHVEFARWATTAVPGAMVGIEGSATYGSALVRSLGSAWPVREVPPHLTRRERIRTRRPGKSDPGDALAIARVTLREHELPPPRHAGASRDLQLLVEARDDLVGEATRMRNRLHADLLVLLPGDRSVAGRMVGPRRLALVASRLRRRSELQAELARARLAALRRLDVEIAALETRIAGRVVGHPLLAIPGVGPLVAAKLIGEVGDVSRLRSADGFAALAGVAPIPASSGQRQRMRLNRGGNRQLNRALFTVAMVQLRHHPPAQAFMARKRSEGKSGREAIRCLKRHLARVVFHALRRGAGELVEVA